MRYAADFRAIARDSLRGNWKTAVITGFVASLLGANIAGDGGSGSSNGDSGDTIALFREILEPEMLLIVRNFLIAAAVVLAIYVIAMIIISGAAKLGYATFNLKLVDKKGACFSDFFSQFNRFGDGFVMNFLIGLFTALWTLLFVIPGIIKSFSYSMTPYVLAEHPEMSATEAITESRRIMNGNKWRLFCLGFSFIGWGLLCAAPMMIATIAIGSIAIVTGRLSVLMWIIPFGIITFIGSLFLTPYMEAAYAAFYRDVSHTEAAFHQTTRDDPAFYGSDGYM